PGVRPARRAVLCRPALAGTRSGPGAGGHLHRRIRAQLARLQRRGHARCRPAGRSPRLADRPANLRRPAGRLRAGSRRRSPRAAARRRLCAGRPHRAPGSRTRPYSGILNPVPVPGASMAAPLIIARNADAQACLLPQLANRHGCITGATGTGKTITLQVLAESFSRIGTPVFMADVKGDLSGISQAGAPSPKLSQRLADLGLPEPAWGGSPATLWDIFGEQGHPIRATVSDLGPLLLARMLDLNDTQEGVLT